MVIFVHGCFWHCHECRYGRVIPSTRPEFWISKRSGNVTRDERNRAKLEEAGWEVGIVWECQTKIAQQLRAVLTSLLPKK
jgi:DNA mismatch endonuclease (patch repair protein)